THTGLLNLLSRAHRANPTGYDPSRVVPDLEELKYYRHRSALLLIDPDWSVRNVGVKLIGLLKDVSKVEHLLFLLTARIPVSPLKRLFGGDFIQVGFIRRNVLVSLMLLDHYQPELEEALLSALDDPYFEVRSQATKAVAWFSQRLKDPLSFQDHLIDRLKDPSFEVAKEAALALGPVGQNEKAVRALLGLRLHHYWQVRQAALTALADLTLRGVVEDAEKLLQEVTAFAITATDFSPRFTIKAAYAHLVETLRRSREEG
ncbi:MAG: HEAT repeat domain-containing protein, partial [Deltaproteobacteria bacterium]|nr:HEAT repeat domain-containing protein [Deltaproteobacteria bacterium]